MIRVRGVTKSFRLNWWSKKKVQVLGGLDFDAFPGQVTGLLGPNGAGKTTFFKGLCGFERFDTGEVAVDGIDPGAQPGLLRGRIAMLPEEPGANLQHSGRHHLTSFGLMMGMSREETMERLAICEPLLQITSYWDRPFKTYSKGQQARIALARMYLAPNAQVLIFDEPSNGLDFESVARLHKFIRQMADDGRTILVASHMLRDLRVLCDRLVGLHEGRQATAEQVEAWMDAHGRQEDQAREKSA